MGSPLCALGMPLPVHAHPTQVIGKMSIERRALVPFRVRWRKQFFPGRHAPTLLSLTQFGKSPADPSSYRDSHNLFTS
jgi:hypothetical protein